MKDTASPENFDRRRAAADYIAALAGELAEIARAERLDLLGHLLDMARQEAHEALRADAADETEP